MVLNFGTNMSKLATIYSKEKLRLRTRTKHTTEMDQPPTTKKTVIISPGQKEFPTTKVLTTSIRLEPNPNIKNTNDVLLIHVFVDYFRL